MCLSGRRQAEVMSPRRKRPQVCLFIGRGGSYMLHSFKAGWKPVEDFFFFPPAFPPSAESSWDVMTGGRAGGPGDGVACYVGAPM